MSRTSRLLVLVITLAACGGGSSAEAPSSGGASTLPGSGSGSGSGTTGATGGGTGAQSRGLPCDVAEVLDASCTSCHGATPTFGAPMPLVTLADLQAPAPSDPGRKVYELVGERIHDAARPMPQRPNPPLDTKALAVLDGWIGAGAPAGSETCGGGGSPTAPPPKTLSCAPDVALRPQTSFAVPSTQSDLYVCYGVDVPVSSKRHVVAVGPHVDNSKVLHHIVLMQVENAVSTTPAPCSPGAIMQGRMLYAWAPGGEPLELPQAAGFPMEGTAHYMVQIHYNNAQALPNQVDATGVDFCTTSELRANDADVVAFGSMKFNIPARGELDLGCDYKIPQQLAGKTMFAAMPHMHQLGTSMATEVIPAGGGSPVDLGAQAAWDFQNQDYFPVSAVTKAGDNVHTRCTWKNPGDTAVTWGENTSDEMCWSFTLYYPRVTSGLWQWALPSVTSKCTSK